MLDLDNTTMTQYRNPVQATSRWISLYYQSPIQLHAARYECILHSCIGAPGRGACGCVLAPLFKDA
jgi:hypothetical protein